MPDLTKTRTILELVDLPHSPELESDEHKWFQQSSEDYDARATRVMLDEAVWHDMGQPHVITVTVEPGDRLNP